MTPNYGKRLAMLAGVALLICLAAVGYARRSPVSAAPSTLQTAAPYQTPNPGQAADLGSSQAYGQSAQQGYAQSTSREDGYYSSFHRPVYVRETPVYRERVEERDHRGRSTRKSVEIVAGTAGVGAVIGAIAGGGKGAAIGAASGGGAGFLYDRLTHNH